MNETLIKQFFEAYSKVALFNTPYTDDMPLEMLTSEQDKDGWVEWKLIDGTYTVNDYREIENKYDIRLPQSFIDWHKAFHFFDCSSPFLYLPNSLPNNQLRDITQNLDWAGELIKQNIYPFANEGNDTGPLVFDARESNIDNEFPIRVYDHEYFESLEGLSPIIFSSFIKLIECMCHYYKNILQKPKQEIISDFFTIDPIGAGDTGVGYWNNWIEMLR